MITDTDWLDLFPTLSTLASNDLEKLLSAGTMHELRSGDTGYRVGDVCTAYVLRVDGWSRIQRVSESGREIVLYRVGPGETCVLTTSCLLGATRYPAESIAESPLREVAVPAAAFRELMARSDPFRQFVIGNYGAVIGDLIMLIDEVSFRRLDIRVAKLLVAESATTPEIERTHHQIAAELGSAREVVSRVLKEFERKNWVGLGRAKINILDRAALQDLSNDSGM